MGTDEEVLRIGKKLDRICSKKEDASQALDLLNALKKIPVDLEVLQKTRIGMTVNLLRKSVSDDQVVSLSKSLIKSWKKLLDDQNKSKLNKEDSNDSTNGNSPNLAVKQENGNSKATSSSNNNNNSNNNGNKSNVSNLTNNTTNNNSKTSSVSFNRPLSFPSLNTSDSVRLKCREMLNNALCVEFGDDVDIKEEILEDPENLAAKIEDCIFKEFKDTNMKYKNRIRSRVANLKDTNNPDLRLNVLRGQITVQRIATMSSEEMASKQMKELRQKFTKEAINDAQMAIQGGTQSDLIKCPKCKKSNTTYNQLQTRSSDEPMTTFVFCNECGKRWKFC